jgi:NADH-quinone oxidoreductase subunit C
MTEALSLQEINATVGDCFPEAVIEAGEGVVAVSPECLYEVADYLKNTPELDFNYLNYISAVDYYDYFEVVYQVTSLEYNRKLVFKTRCPGRDDPSLPSVVSLWRGADYQEREIYDLMGIRFENHPNMKRIVLWEGFRGHPLRKDFIQT